jgi:hypothetical protein
MKLVIQVGTDDGWATLTLGEHGQPRSEIEVMADRWRASHLFGGAPIRVVEDRPERHPGARVAAEAPT